MFKTFGFQVRPDFINPRAIESWLFDQTGLGAEDNGSHKGSHPYYFGMFP